MKNITEDYLLDLFIGTLKDNIQHEVHLWEPTSLDHAFRVARKVENKITETWRSTTCNCKEGSVVSNDPKPTRLTQQQLEEKGENWICYSCDRKYSKGHKCIENKLFYIDCEKEEEMNKKHQKKRIHTRNWSKRNSSDHIR